MQSRNRMRRIPPAKKRFAAKQDAKFNEWLKTIRWAELVVSPTIYSPLEYPTSSFWLHEAKKKGLVPETATHMDSDHGE
jgi:hypothetical protein